MSDESKPEEPKPPVSNNSMNFRTEEVYQSIQGWADVIQLSDTKPDSHILVEAGSLRDLCIHLRDDPDWQFNVLHCVSGLDQGDKLGVVYHLFSMTKRHFVVLKVEVPKDSPTVPSLTGLWPAADWLERETYDLLGVVFEGHPDPRRILLPEDWEGHPLRKDYEMPEHEELREKGY